MDDSERILKMLEEGKITADEAAKLLNALGESQRWSAGGHRMPFGPEFGKRIAKKVELSLKDLPETIATTISGTGFVTGAGECKKLKFDAKENLVIKSVSGDTEIKGDDEDSIRLNMCGGRRIKEADNELIIKTMAGDMELQVPKTQKVVLKSASGDIKAVNLAELTVRTGSGDIEIENVTERLATALGSGDLDIKNVSGVIAVTLGSGDLDADHISGEATMTLGSGDADIVFDECKGGRLEVGSGDLTVTIPADSSLEVTVHKPRSGEIESDFELEIPEDRDVPEEFTFNIGKKPKGKLYLRTKYGDLTLRKKEE